METSTVYSYSGGILFDRLRAAKPVVMHLLSGQPVKVQGNVAMFVGVGLYTVLNYFGQRFFAFRSAISKAQSVDRADQQILGIPVFTDIFCP